MDRAEETRRVRLHIGQIQASWAASVSSRAADSNRRIQSSGSTPAPCRAPALEIGPVLHADDAVANKGLCLFGRAEVRDYIDLDSIARSGQNTLAHMLSLAADHDPGFRSEPSPTPS